MDRESNASSSSSSASVNCGGCKLAAAKVGDKLGLGRLAFEAVVVLKVARGTDDSFSACTISSNRSRSASAIGGVATALGNEAWAATTEGLMSSSNDTVLFSDTEVMKDKPSSLFCPNGSCSIISGVGNKVGIGEWLRTEVLGTLLWPWKDVGRRR